MKNKVYLYFRASFNNSVIYVKICDTIMEDVFDSFYDRGYTMIKSDSATWESNIDSGLSYEIDNENEVKEFVDNNELADSIRNGTV